jgi:hypothetical protein
MANQFTVTIDGKDYTRHVPFPIKWENSLDDRLDYARISMKKVDDEVFTPLTPIEIIMTDRNNTEYALKQLVSTDSSVEVPPGSGKYNHDMYIIEQTKILEGILVDALTFTNDLGRNYTKNAKPINVKMERTGNLSSPFNDALVNNIRNSLTPKATETSFVFPSIKEIFANAKNEFGELSSTAWSQEYCTIIGPKGPSNPIRDFFSSQTSTPKQLDNEQTMVTSLEQGSYTATYRYTWTNAAHGGQAIVEFTFYAVPNHEPLPRWNIASVIDRVLDLCEPHLEGVEPRFKLNAEQHAEFEKIEAPEFAFTNCTLKEILNQIGGYIHGIPRLKGNTIYYDMLGGTKQAKLYTTNHPYATKRFAQDIESYCSSLDSTVDNLVCLTDREQGTITEPYYNGYKTVRTETVYARVEEGNMFISTKYPIQEIRWLKCSNYGETDITDYVFEEADYSRMSSYAEQYPTSKSYALYYTQGTKNIYGLNYKVPDATGGIFERYAILNILREATGQDIADLDKDYPTLAFQISYIPVFPARVQQTKQYIGNIKQPRTLYYNQNANLIETRHYGENLKGAVARMGTVDKTIIYTLGDFSLIPEIGEMFGDDYYVSDIVCELYPEFIRCQVSLSQDFNRLSQYIGINSTRRFYEVSEKQAYRRDIKYADYLVIGDKVEEDDTLLRSLSTLKRALEGGTVPGLYAIYGIDHVVAEGRDENGGPLEKVLLPVVTTAQGNAMVFTFNYEDNYSAGAQVQHQEAGGVSGYFTNAVAYADYYGRMKTLRFAMNNSVNEAVDGMLLPQTELPYNVGPIRADTKGLVVRKDGREILSVNYVVEFVTNKRNYIIGSAVARNAGYVKTMYPEYADGARLYVLRNKIPKFADTIDTSDAKFVWDFFRGHITEGDSSLKFEDFVSEIDGEAWAVVTGRGEFYFGSNEPIKAGQTVTMPYISLRHDIFNLGGKNN